MGSIVLNGMTIVAAAFFALMVAASGAYWGPEGPVGGWLLMIPPLFLTVGIVALMILTGRFDWIPGGRLASVFLLAGFAIAAAAGMWWGFDHDTLWKRLAGLAPWIMLAGCFVAINAGRTPGRLSTITIAATLGTSAVAGWGLAVWGAGAYIQHQNEQVLAQVAFNDRMRNERVAEFRALGADAPLWQYFGYMFLDDEEARTECRDIIAHRSDLDDRLIEYLGNEILASQVRNYVGRVYEHPPARLAPAYAQYMERQLAGYRPVLEGKPELTDRAEDDVRAMIRAVTRIQQSGGDLRPQLRAWRDYVASFRGTGELVQSFNALLQ